MENNKTAIWEWIVFVIGELFYITGVLVGGIFLFHSYSAFSDSAGWVSLLSFIGLLMLTAIYLIALAFGIWLTLYLLGVVDD